MDKSGSLLHGIQFSAEQLETAMMKAKRYTKLNALVGQQFFWRGDWARIMAEVDGYVMARKKGCMPFVVHMKDIEGPFLNKGERGGGSLHRIHR